MSQFIGHQNYLGGVGETDLQYEKLQESLRLPPGELMPKTTLFLGMARSFRDDISVIVVSSF